MMVCINRDARKVKGLPDIYYRTCFWCRDNFGIPRNIYRGKIKLGQRNVFCSEKCLAEHDAWVLQVKRIRDARERIRDECEPMTRHAYRCQLPRKMCKRGHEMGRDKYGRCRECRRIGSRKYWRKRAQKKAGLA